MNAWKPIVAALVIFAAGVVTGGFTVKLTSHKEPRPKVITQVALVATNLTGAVQTPSGQPGANGQRPPGPPGPGPAWGSPRGQWLMKDLLERMDRELVLTPDQHQRVDGIMKESQERMHKIYENFIPELNSMRAQIRDQLTPEQQAKFENVFKQRDDFRKRNPGEGKSLRPKHETNPPSSFQRPPAGE